MISSREDKVRIQHHGYRYRDIVFSPEGFRRGITDDELIMALTKPEN